MNTTTASAKIGPGELGSSELLLHTSFSPITAPLNIPASRQTKKTKPAAEASSKSPPGSSKGTFNEVFYAKCLSAARSLQVFQERCLHCWEELCLFSLKRSTAFGSSLQILS
ncbi:hypothetical protein DSO57_1027165 [Entomophthora muscae]|uniref:Uncharacterized protein n=1 Tax=Entomophthora muscae TaxID=34485 RepID=A0ACC2TP28_9FUNG|nr:hypothetical protein DSO57_1027165 [Entomophthora muscae]